MCLNQFFAFLSLEWHFLLKDFDFFHFSLLKMMLWSFISRALKEPKCLNHVQGKVFYVHKNLLFINAPHRFSIFDWKKICSHVNDHQFMMKKRKKMNFNILFKKPTSLNKASRLNRSKDEHAASIMALINFFWDKLNSYQFIFVWNCTYEGTVKVTC